MAYLKEVIISEEKEGCGEEHDPIRIVTKIFEKNGDLITEIDPCDVPYQYTRENLINFAKHCKKLKIKVETIDHITDNEINDWIK